MEQHLLNKDYHVLSISDISTLFSSDLKNGLTHNQIEKSRKQYGFNQLEQKKKTPLLIRFFSQFADFMTLILIAAAILSLIVSYLEGNPDFTDPFIITAIIIVNAMIGTFQESRAEHSLEALKQLSSPHAKVIRDGILENISSKDLVPGDFVLLEAGDMVPADLRLVESCQLQTDESALTGESASVSKNAFTKLSKSVPLAERCNMCYSSSSVISGHGSGIVVATGMQTEVGAIARLISEEKVPPTPLQKRLASLGKVLGMLALFICGAIFFLGITQGRPIIDMFMTSVSLAVASIPEGLPIVVTIMLSLGVQRMVKKNTIVRRLPAVETLGCATVICSDKTGTLTQNKMQITAISSITGKERTNSSFSHNILSLAVLCCDSHLQYKNNQPEIYGDSTENAIVLAALQLKHDKNNLDSKHKRLAELPFDSVRKMMSVIVSHEGKLLQITKGAFDLLLPNCTHCYKNGRIVPLTSHDLSLAKRENECMTKQALRVIALAIRELPSDSLRISNTASTPAAAGIEEKNLTFVGLLGMIDPPRPEVKDAIATCKSASITPIMITGDHISTAVSIAKDLNILSDEAQAICGADLNLLSDSELSEKVEKYRVFARVSPTHKVRIVKALQKNSHVVAMTGDGVNDAPALNVADIGCAMGLSGTDVAKNSADLILTDDNFATIVSAVREGRGIYDNIQKSIHFLLSSNTGELLTIFTAILFHLPSPLLAIHLLWINLITDSLPAIALGVEAPDKEIMKRSPIGAGQSLFAHGLGVKIILEGCMIGALSLCAFLLGYFYLPNHNLLLGQTMCFAVLSLSQLFHSFNMRSTRSLFEIGFFSNKKLTVSFLICFFLQMLVITVPSLQNIFHVANLNVSQWVLVLIFSFLPILVVEIQKMSYNEKN